MLKVLFFLICNLFSDLAAAALMDYSVSTGARWLPKSGGVWGGMGINFLLWGENKDGSFAYGYFRPVLKATTSGTVNQVQLDLNLFPVSFFGFTVGHTASYRAKEFDDVPCNTYLCTGNVQTTDFRAHLIFGYQKWFFVLDKQFAWVVAGDTTKDFIDENTMLINHKNGDRNFNSELAIGYKFNEQWNVGVNFWDTRIEATANTNIHRSVFLSYKKDRNISYVGGVGFYESNLQARDTTVYGVIRWQSGESLALIR